MAFQPRRRALLQGALAAPLAPFASTLLAPAAAHAQSAWPSRPIRFITQSAPGDAVELRLREFLKDLTPLLNNQPLVVENKPGAGGVLSHQAVLNAPADGHTVLLANAAMTIVPSIYRKISYNPVRDFQPVAFSGLAPIGLAIPASRPEKTLKDWLAWARTQGGKLNYASPGNGSVSHLYGFQLSDQFGLNATHVPYKGVAPAMLDLLGGNVHFILLDIFNLRALLDKGDIRLLAVAMDERFKYTPSVPTFKELGYSGYDRLGWTGYYVKAGTPQPIVDQLAAAINKLNTAPDWAAKRGVTWSHWVNMSPRDMAERFKYETEAWGAIVRKTGFVAD